MKMKLNTNLIRAVCRIKYYYTTQNIYLFNIYSYHLKYYSISCIFSEIKGKIIY